MASFQTRIMAGVLPFLLVAPVVALAQVQPSRYSASEVTRTTTTTEAVYTRQQVDQLIAPIALYPDPLLTHVLMAATHPQQIVEAAHWLEVPAHAALHGEALIAALRPLPWAPSVKALAAVPQVIFIMAEHIEWTQALGIAVGVQQNLVMAQVQSLRHLAVRSGQLRHARDLAVHQRGDIIVITSTERDRVLVPVYNPVVVYGRWPAPEYPPVFLPPPRSLRYEMVTHGFGVSIGYSVPATLWTWSRPDWRDRSITINRNEVTRITQNIELGPGDVWHHRGPIVLAAPLTAQRSRVRTGSGPAGTVAPIGAAAVAALPERAQRMPNLIEMPKTAGRRGGENSGINQAAGSQNFGAQGSAQQSMQQRPATGATNPAERSRNQNQTTTGEPTGQAGGINSGSTTPPEQNRNPAATGERTTTVQPMHKQGGAATSTANEPEHNRHQPTPTEPTSRRSGVTTGEASQPEHRRNPATTNEPARAQGGTTADEASSRSQHNRHPTTANAPEGGQRSATGEANRSEHHRNGAAEQARHNAATSSENRAEHRRNQATATGGATAGSVNRSEHPPNRATSEPSGGTATGPEHHRGRAMTTEPGAARSGSHGSTGEHSFGHQETTGEGASAPGAASAHATSKPHEPANAAGAGGSEPTRGH